MERLIAKLRGDLGDGMEIMIDCYLSWDVEFASRVAQRVREYDVKWFETRSKMAGYNSEPVFAGAYRSDSIGYGQS